MPFQWLEDLGKVITVHSRWSTKSGCKQDAAIPAGIPSVFLLPSPELPLNSSLVQPVSASREPDLEVSTSVSSTGYSWSVSLTREASDMAQLALPLIQGIASSIPLVGAPM
ncbi:uncharacterized protein EDB91DRAFT_1339007 [Suillus paluster]|uniref:uncharacterized protein n=1 Tax=Suillus paluster TaxID=48578 RepID=UPI001B85BCA1|nr:uncharacterized protein EDB91DRAFT_1339007 [Suillus paluster]KAG1729487.1 hypothetical protein EDB91DRAFT_1339007 [Suillus paluster]